MDKIRRVAPTFVLWAVVVAGFGAVAAAHAWWPSILRHASALPGDTLPGALRKPTPGELEAARRSAMRRRFGVERHGPSVEDVIEYHNRHHIGPPSPPDAVGPRE